VQSVQATDKQAEDTTCNCGIAMAARMATLAQCALARRSKRQRVSWCDDLGCPHGVGRGGRVVVFGAW